MASYKYRFAEPIDTNDNKNVYVLDMQDTSVIFIQHFPPHWIVSDVTENSLKGMKRWVPYPPHSDPQHMDI